MMHADLAFKSPVKIFGVNFGKDPLILYFVFVLNRISIEIGCSHDKQKYLGTCSAHNVTCSPPIWFGVRASDH